MTMFGGQSPIPIKKTGVTAEIRQAIESACRSIYRDKSFSLQVLAYRYGILLMYSVNAYSRLEIDPAEVNFGDIESTFISSMPTSSCLKTDIILGRLSYPAPSSAKFLITVEDKS